jgi:hypothetical protein
MTIMVHEDHGRRWTKDPLAKLAFKRSSEFISGYFEHTHSLTLNLCACRRELFFRTSKRNGRKKKKGRKKNLTSPFLFPLFL